MTTNTAGTRTPGNTHATLGAGTPARSDHQGGLALNYDETWMGIEAGLLYQQLTGDPTFPTGQVILPRLPEAFRVNFSPVRTAVPCLLGQVLHENNLRTAVFGNADPAPPTAGSLLYTHNRFAPWIAADHRGLVDYGDIGHPTLQPGAGLLPWETNYEYLVAKYQEFRAKADLLVLELGDFARLEALSPYLFDRQITVEKKRLFSRLDRFTQTIWPLFDGEHDTVILLTPTPSLVNLKQGAYLTPCLVWGKDFPAGFLSSPTTRRVGLVANVDLVPTVFRLFNLGLPTHIAGRAMTAGHKGELPTLLQFETKLNTISLFRRKVLPVLLNGVAFCLPLTFLSHHFTENTGFSSGKIDPPLPVAFHRLFIGPTRRLTLGLPTTPDGHSFFCWGDVCHRFFPYAPQQANPPSPAGSNPHSPTPGGNHGGTAVPFIVPSCPCPPWFDR